MFWHWRDFEKPHAMERLMPNGEMTLVVNLHEDVVRVYDRDSLRLTQTVRGAVLVGAYSEPMAIDSEEQKEPARRLPAFVLRRMSSPTLMSNLRIFGEANNCGRA